MHFVFVRFSFYITHHFAEFSFAFYLMFSPMQPVNISTSDTLQYPLSVCRYKIVFNYQELTNIHDVLFAFASLFDPPFAYINCDYFRSFVENVSRTTRKWFFIQLYNYPTLANCFHSFIHMIDIFCLGASLVIVCCVFGFQLSSHRKGGKRKDAVNPLQEAEYADLSILYIWYIYSLAYDFFSIFKSLFVREFFYGLSHLHSIQNNCVQWGIYFVINEDI